MRIVCTQEEAEKLRNGCDYSSCVGDCWECPMNKICNPFPEGKPINQFIQVAEKQMDEQKFLDYLNSPEYKNRPLLCLHRSEPSVETAWGDPYMNMILIAVFMFPWFGSDEEKGSFNPFSCLEEHERKKLSASFRAFCEKLPESGMSIDMIPLQLRKAFDLEGQNG